MTAPRIDYRALFAAEPSPCIVLDPDFVVIDANRAYLLATGRTRREMIGHHLFDVHPDNPADPDATGVHNLSASLRRVLRSKRPDTMAVQKYDVPMPGRPGTFQAKWWSPVNTPVLGADGQVEWIMHRVEDMTDFMLANDLYRAPEEPDATRHALEAELYVRAQELQRLNEELREAHDRERETALTLQEAMLYSPDLVRHPDIAVRYIPAARTLNVCGDWYDVVDLSEDRFAVMVGDVVGHGLQAAAVMGVLRTALSAAVRAQDDPVRAMEVLTLYARTLEGAMATTAAKALVDTRRRRIVYTSAGHPPPLLAHPDGTVTVLDQATDPPLGVLDDETASTRATVPYTPRDTLVLYTDGLIERRDECIDAGLHRLTDALSRHADLGPEDLATTLLDALAVPEGGRDDIALLAVRL